MWASIASSDFHARAGRIRAAGEGVNEVSCSHWRRPGRALAYLGALPSKKVDQREIIVSFLSSHEYTYCITHASLEISGSSLAS